MKKIYIIYFVFIVMSFLLLLCSQNPNLPLYQQKTASVEERVEDLLSRMTLEEKIDQLSGEGFDTRINERLGIPALRMADGPAGVRWGPATAFPAPVAMASTWDEDLLFRIGQVIGREMKSKGRNFFLGPCINIHRHPLGGRNFESFGEDPFLVSQMAVPYIQGVQSEGVLACAKHYACNNQEWRRHRVDVHVSERALREIYLPHFKSSVQDGNVRTVMAAYNVFRGDHCSESAHLLNTVLKNEWGFQGFVVSDWGSVYSTVKAANNGLDLEMPWGEYFDDKLLQAVKNGEVKESIIDDKIRRLLRVRFESGIFDRKDQVDPSVIKRTDHKKVALEAAIKGMVLLKNEDDLLPLDKKKIKALAVIGPNAAVARVGGGGSARVSPLKAVSGLEGLQKLVGDQVEILYAPGTAAQDDILPFPVEYVKAPNGEHGWQADYYANTELKGEPVLSRIDKAIDFKWSYDAPHPALHAPDDENLFSIRWKGEVIPPETGRYKFLFVNNDGVRLYVNGKNVIDRWGHHRSAKHSGSFNLEKGKSYEFVVEYMFEGGISEVTFGWAVPGQDLIQEAVQIAEQADAAVIFSGLSKRFESESFDRTHMDLPHQAKLIQAVAAANPKTVVVNQTGAPVTMNGWVNQVPAILQAWYPGQAGGTAMAGVLFGEESPSGKLPCSFIQRPEHSPSFKGYMNPNLIGDYHEGIYVGYRYLDKEKIDPLFPFGHGLTYTRFEYSDLKINKKEDGSVQIEVYIKNVGDRKGTETIQIYVKDLECSVDRPEQELKGFKKVTLKPGTSKRVQISLEKNAFTFFNEKLNQWVVEPGDFEIRVGSSSKDLRLSDKIEL